MNEGMALSGKAFSPGLVALLCPSSAQRSTQINTWREFKREREGSRERSRERSREIKRVSDDQTCFDGGQER